MTILWDQGAMYVNDILDMYKAPKLHFNTISTIIRSLEKKGFVSHEKFGHTHRYFAIINREEYRAHKLNKVISKYYDNTYLGIVSSFIKEDKISIEEFKRLIETLDQE